MKLDNMTGTLSYERVNNLGNYSSERLSLSVELKEENAETVFVEVKQFVLSNLGLTPKKEVETIAQEPVQLTLKPEVNHGEEKSSSKEVSEKSDPKEEVISEEPAVEVEAKKTKKATATKVKKVAKPVGTPYNRGNEIHKKIMGDLLDKTIPGWRSNAAKAVEVSKSLEGQEFLDSEGLVLETFKEEFKKRLG